MGTRLVAGLVIVMCGPLGAKVNFMREVKPILENHCVRCHGPDRAMKNLRLDYERRARMAIVAKKPEGSRIYAAMKSGFMPPTEKKLTPAELETIRKWIAEGARWPKGVELTGKNPFLPEAGATAIPR